MKKSRKKKLPTKAVANTKLKSPGASHRGFFFAFLGLGGGLTEGRFVENCFGINDIAPIPEGRRLFCARSEAFYIRMLLRRLGFAKIGQHRFKITEFGLGVFIAHRRRNNNVLARNPVCWRCNALG